MRLMRGGVLDMVLKGSGQHPEGGRQGKAFLPEDMQQVSSGRVWGQVFLRTASFLNARLRAEFFLSFSR